MSPREFSILDAGAAADGATDDAPAIQRAIDAAHAAGGGRVLIPSGTRIRAGSFELRSGVDFHLAAGAELLSATTEAAFPAHVFDFGEESDKRVWIRARHAGDITLSGSGTIDGQCRAFALGENEHIFTPTLKWRPALTCFEDVRRLTIRGLTFRDAANWTLHFTGCEDVLVEDVRIFNNLKFPNADGIDPDHCRRVRIRGCHIVSADDCIVLKNTAPFTRYGDCEDIDISDCRLESVSAAFKVGSESHNDFRRVRMRDCTIERSNRGLAFQIRDGATAEDFEFSNITIGTRRFAPAFWGAAEPLYLTVLPRNRNSPPGLLRNIRFHHIRCQGENGLVAFSDPPGRIQDIHLDNVHLAIERSTPWPAGLLDLRPFQDGYEPPAAERLGESTPWGHPVRREPAVCSFDGVAGIHAHRTTCSLPTELAAEWTILANDQAPPGFQIHPA